MESEQEFLYQFFVRNVLPFSELTSNAKDIGEDIWDNGFLELKMQNFDEEYLWGI